MISKIHDVKNPLSNAAFDNQRIQNVIPHSNKKTRIPSSREISGKSQNSFLSYNQRNKPSTAQKDIFGTYSTSFRKVCVLLKRQKLFL